MRGRGPWVIRRLPLLLLVSGALLKAAVIAGFRFTGSQTAYELLTVYDPVSVWLAERAWAWLSTNEGSSPTMHDPILFDVLLVLGCALAVLLAGNQSESYVYEPTTHAVTSAPDSVAAGSEAPSLSGEIASG